MTLPPPEHDDPAPIKAPPDSEPTFSRELIMLCIGLLLSFLATVLLIAVVPQFKSVFASMGADLPLATRLLVQFYPALVLLPLLVLLSWFTWPAPERRGMVALLSGIACMVLGPLLVGGILYLPILTLDAAV